MAFRHARNGTRTWGWQRHASPTRHPSDVCREEGGIFRFSLPLQDLVNVDLQPEVYIRYGLVLLCAWLCVWLALLCVWLALLCRLERPCWLALLCARLCTATRPVVVQLGLAAGGVCTMCARSQEGGKEAVLFAWARSSHDRLTGPLPRLACPRLSHAACSRSRSCGASRWQAPARPWAHQKSTRRAASAACGNVLGEPLQSLVGR